MKPFPGEGNDSITPNFSPRPFLFHTRETSFCEREITPKFFTLNERKLLHLINFELKRKVSFYCSRRNSSTTDFSKSWGTEELGNYDFATVMDDEPGF